MAGPRETLYDEKISPLVTEIIKLCKEHKIPMVASFELDLEEGYAEHDPMLCSTVLLVPEWPTRSSTLKHVKQVLYPPAPIALAEMEVTNPDGSKSISIRRIS